MWFVMHINEKKGYVFFVKGVIPYLKQHPHVFGFTIYMVDRDDQHRHHQWRKSFVFHVIKWQEP
jgi:hypothetical protein